MYLWGGMLLFGPFDGDIIFMQYSYGLKLSFFYALPFFNAWYFSQEETKAFYYLSLPFSDSTS